MAAKNTEDVATTTPTNGKAASTAANDLATAAQALAQAAQALTAALSQLQRLPPVGAGVATAAAAQINAWEDDPFSEAVPTANPPLAQVIAVSPPVNSAQLLRTSTVELRPASDLFGPGTSEFRYWAAEDALVRGVNFWALLLPTGTKWSAAVDPLRVTLVADRDLNARYSRLFGLQFYEWPMGNVTIFSGESPDVVLHELGHAVLDALRPPLFNAASLEVAAFHEAFGDMSAILGALQVPTLRRTVLAETQGKLNVDSRLSRVAEQLGWAIRQVSPTAVDSDSLRNAANRFFYRRPDQLPPTAPANLLSAEAHSFSRVFTGAFLDALAGMLGAAGAATETSLMAISRDLGQLLVDGVLTAPITSDYYSQVAANMIQADQGRNAGRYRVALTGAFARRGILSLESFAALAGAPVPSLVPAQQVGVLGADNITDFSVGRSAAQTLLAYDGRGDEDYALGYEETHELPLRAIATGLGIDIRCHIADEPVRFAVAPGAYGMASVGAPSPEADARHFVEDLMQLGRIELGSTASVATPLREVLAGIGRNKTHAVEVSPDGVVLKRLHFDCGLCRH